MLRKKIKQWWKKGVILLFWLMVWQWMSWKIGQDILLVSPIRVGETLIQLLEEPSFWLAVGSSLGKIMLGFMLAVVLGTVLGLVAYRFPFVHELLYPVLSVIKATPVASFIILALVWIKSANLSTFIAFLMVVPMIYTNVYQGMNSVDGKLLEVAKVFGLGPWGVVKFVYIPSLLPYIISGCTVGLGLAWKSGVAAEVIGLPKHSIGGYLYDAKIYLETDQLLAWTVVVVLLSVIMEKMLLIMIRNMKVKMGLKG